MSPLIVIIDQDHKTREDVAQLLRTHHYTSALASSFRQGLHLIKKSKPSLIIADLALPDSNGLKVVHQIRALIMTIPEMYIGEEL